MKEKFLGPAKHQETSEATAYWTTVTVIFEVIATSKRYRRTVSFPRYLELIAEFGVKK